MTSRVLPPTRRRGPRPGSPRGPRLSREARERQLIGIAERIFAERGFANTTMAMIAAQAGITKPVIYDHFGSKEGLLAAVIEQASLDLADAVAGGVRAVRPDASAEESFRAGVRAYFEFADAHALAWRRFIRDGQVGGLAAPTVEAARGEQRASLVDELRRVPAFGTLPTGQLEGVVEGLIGACERIAVWRAERPTVDADAATEMVMSLTWHGISALIDADGIAGG
ncbi:MAG: TetR/AcrR family transcriptional regulator [Tetrasphaera sp.]